MKTYRISSNLSIHGLMVMHIRDVGNKVEAC
jgi:hypothetical protein